jgi:hypothetical protein
VRSNSPDSPTRACRRQYAWWRGSSGPRTRRLTTAPFGVRQTPPLYCPVPAVSGVQEGCTPPSLPEKAPDVHLDSAGRGRPLLRRWSTGVSACLHGVTLNGERASGGETTVHLSGVMR